jgi:hypothetical protein
MVVLLGFPQMSSVSFRVFRGQESYREPREHANSPRVALLTAMGFARTVSTQRRADPARSRGSRFQPLAPKM